MERAQEPSAVPVELLGLEAETVRNETLRVGSPLLRRYPDVSGTLFALLAMPEPVVELLPAHFLPVWAEQSVSGDVLRELAVAAKLVYGQVRWLDGLADGQGPTGPPSAVHRLHAAFDGLVRSKFAAAMADSPAAPGFFSTLAHLQARYAASLALDKGWVQSSENSAGLDDYVEHAKARAVPVRASLDAVLLYVGAPEEEIDRARRCFESCAAGLQLYDDALDAEEDFRQGRLSWVVNETLEALKHRGAGDAPDSDHFYEGALLSGSLTRNLAAAESLFEESIGQAKPTFPNFAQYAESRKSRVRTLREDYVSIAAKYLTG